MSDVILDMAEKMEKSVEAFKNDLAKIKAKTEAWVWT